MSPVELSSASLLIKIDNNFEFNKDESR
jgi:hypothetical protein